MAAPRKYSDGQREAMVQLAEAGKRPAEIARLCREGEAGVDAFDVPRRSCHDIVERELARREAELAADTENQPLTRISRILDGHIDRLERKTKLNVDDLELLRKTVDLSAMLEARLRKRKNGSGPSRSDLLDDSRPARG